MKMKLPASGPEGPIYFDVWGARGSRNLAPNCSKIGTHTSCYSLFAEEDLMILDAGRGMARLSHSTRIEERFKTLKRVHVLVSHAHLDHWEGLKDAEWLWIRNNGIELSIYGTAQALSSIRGGHDHPSFVPLDVLAKGTVESLSYIPLDVRGTRSLGPWTVETWPLNHYSGGGDDRHDLDTIGFRLSRPDGPIVAYLSDHEPTPDTQAMEREIGLDANLIVYDSHFLHIKQQAYGHGSQEHTATVARRNPFALVIAGHLGPGFSDVVIKEAFHGYRKAMTNFHLAKEGCTYQWDVTSSRFVRSRASLAADADRSETRE